MKKGMIGLIVSMLLLTVMGCDTPLAESDVQPVAESSEEQSLVEDPVDIMDNSIETNKQNESSQENSIQHDPRLIAYFPFDDDTNDVVTTIAGEKRGNPKIKPGIIGNALYLDGVDDYVDISSGIDSIGILRQGTIAFWINFDSVLDEQTVMPIFYLGIENKPRTDNMFIIEIGHAAGTEDYTEHAAPGTPDPTNTRIYATWIKNGQEPFLCSDSETNIIGNSWQHFAVISGEKGNTLYLNGEEVKKRDYNFGHSTDTAFLADIPVKDLLTIGYGKSHEWISPEFEYYKGYIDDFRIYNEPLSAEEVKKLYELDQ